MTRCRTGQMNHFCLTEVVQRLELQGWTIEVVDLDGRLIDKLLVGRAG
jgi:putative hemolysin